MMLPNGVTTVNSETLVEVPPAVFTLIFPVVAPAGASATIFVAALEITLAFSPLNVTFVASARFVPVIVTSVPGVPDDGLKLLMVGSGVEAADAATAGTPQSETMNRPTRRTFRPISAPPLSPSEKSPTQQTDTTEVSLPACLLAGPS